MPTPSTQKKNFITFGFLVVYSFWLLVPSLLAARLQRIPFFSAAVYVNRFLEPLW